VNPLKKKGIGKKKSETSRPKKGGERWFEKEKRKRTKASPKKVGCHRSFLSQGRGGKKKGVRPKKKT